MRRTQFAVFASGRGSNFESIQENIQTGAIHGDIVCVISNNAAAPVLVKAQQLQIPTYHITQSQFADTQEYSTEIVEILTRHLADYAVLAGYMKMIPGEILHHYHNQFLNIHPALLPAFGGKGYYGMKVHTAVIDSGVKWTGVTVHFVDEIYDHGPIIYQHPVRVMDEDTPETLAQRVLQYEHEAFPRVLRWISQGWITVKENKTYYSGPEEEWIVR